MAERADIAQGFPKTPKENVQSFREELAGQLNSLGPPVKDTTTWKKVWLDYESYVKRKLSLNKIESRATRGGGNRMQSFNNMEETVIRICGLETSTSGIRGAQAFGAGRNRSVSESNAASPPVTPVAPGINDCSMHSVPEDVPSTSRIINAGSREDTSTRALLQKQIKIQQQYYKESMEFAIRAEGKIDDIATSLNVLSKANESFARTQMQMLEETRRHNGVMEELKREEIDRIFMLDRPNN